MKYSSCVHIIMPTVMRITHVHQAMESSGVLSGTPFLETGFLSSTVPAGCGSRAAPRGLQSSVCHGCRVRGSRSHIEHLLPRAFGGSDGGMAAAVQGGKYRVPLQGGVSHTERLDRAKFTHV